MRTSLVALTAILLIVLIAGCGDGIRPVSGTITLNGEPLPRARVIFIPREGGRTNSFAKTNAQGAYELTYTSSRNGAMAGSYDVLIKAREIEENPDAPETTEAIRSVKIPVAYSRKGALSADVTAGGENVFDFDLTTK